MRQVQQVIGIRFTIAGIKQYIAVGVVGVNTGNEPAYGLQLVAGVLSILGLRGILEPG
ncbi:hypothetical protein [Mucilaginibacter sp.]|uniref:hypothetical protein n=1 Tax=Mucilaginibacter sp. TaxID=1882438 RepID=UPI0032631EDB